ncbi:MAG TPA: phospholipase D-like domain-containing protein [Gemmatimonadales bacterium]|nr:phospholipase D-like domain-containing protein [Gemmatimonadales bacterium]
MRKLGGRQPTPIPWHLIAGVLALAVVALLGAGLAHLLRAAPLDVVVGHAGSPPPGIGEPQFLRTMTAVADAPVLAGNRIDVLSNGDQTFPRLFADLRAARRSIALQMYYESAGSLADTLLRILADRARAGVPVYFLCDALGADRLPARHRTVLRAAGVHVASFHPFRWYELDRAGHRAHTRAIVVDGSIGYTGGFGLDDKWLGNGRKRGQWRDTNVRFTGPAVTQLQAAFVKEWSGVTGELLIGEHLFPLRPASVTDSGASAGVLHSVPSSGTSPAERALALSIAGARRTLYISNSYFVPNGSFRGLLRAAARRGVDVRILTTGEDTDVGVARMAGRSHYEDLLAAGVRVFEYQPSMMHAKTLVADGVWSSIGTMNFDNRSLALNNEATLLVMDPAIGAVMDSLFREDLAYASEITLERFRRRSWTERVLERAARLLARLV